MDNWWLDETPYPGPAYEASWSELITRLRDILTSTGLATVEAVASVREVNEAFKQLMFPEMPKTQAELRAHALEYIKNRNTGPTAEWGFNRDGSRT